MPKCFFYAFKYQYIQIQPSSILVITSHQSLLHVAFCSHVFSLIFVPIGELQPPYPTNQVICGALQLLRLPGLFILEVVQPSTITLIMACCGAR